ncbi:MAG: 4-(cytidine 5'-diphospho)-2-C-methyl-D-erythritol kinase [Verrucomicrobia bacterium]|nr:4-(cytidine 5'-diphospho)-2-C-methyl-D-erythritol kinase [Verrucomicrobiota bacterium]MBV9673053.1 4-(cytidine 5'-diphospho)-2-C-methyl-D-erythritol kinase [Verrucomicrobiota bacterium]
MEQLKAFAKVNVTLEILGRRLDGYHDLATWIVPIELHDVLEINFADETRFKCNSEELAVNSSNLVIRAVDLFCQAIGSRTKYDIRLDKQIPIGAGLGGGSSNAAATLRILNKLHREPFDEQHLEQLAAHLGSDVAVFVRGLAAWCTGRGETVEPRSFPQNLWICLFKPGFGVSTAFAYRAFAALPKGKRKGDEQLTSWGTLRNDLEPAVFPKFILLSLMKEWLLTRPESLCSLMSGSGSTVFAIVESREAGLHLSDEFQNKFGLPLWRHVCRINAGFES